MAKQIYLTPLALHDLDNVSNYLFENWGLTVLENFLAVYEAKILLISQYPERYPLINHSSQIRKTVLTKHNIIFYREKNAYIEIISIFDSRQEPTKVNRLL